VLFTIGAIAVQRQPAQLKAAETSFGAASRLASDLEMRPLVAHCHLGLGTLYRRTGDRAKAEEHLTTATAMYGSWRTTRRSTRTPRSTWTRRR
jgi:hypothetical protein